MPFLVLFVCLNSFPICLNLATGRVSLSHSPSLSGHAEHSSAPPKTSHCPSWRALTALTFLQLTGGSRAWLTHGGLAMTWNDPWQISRTIRCFSSKVYLAIDFSPGLNQVWWKHLLLAELSKLGQGRACRRGGMEYMEKARLYKLRAESWPQQRGEEGDNSLHSLQSPRSQERLAWSQSQGDDGNALWWVTQGVVLGTPWWSHRGEGNVWVCSEPGAVAASCWGQLPPAPADSLHWFCHLVFIFMNHFNTSNIPLTHLST